MCEVFSCGERPYDALSNRRVTEEIRTGKRLKRPLRCPVPVYDLMLEMWSADPSLRPDFWDAESKLLNIVKALGMTFNVIFPQRIITFQMAWLALRLFGPQDLFVHSLTRPKPITHRCIRALLSQIRENPTTTCKNTHLLHTEIRVLSQAHITTIRVPRGGWTQRLHYRSYRRTSSFTPYSCPAGGGRVFCLK